MDSTIRAKLLAYRDEFAAEGFAISGVFGSVARGDQEPRSDIDILYRLDPNFHDRYKGLEALRRIEEIRLAIESGLRLDVDFADEDCLDDVGRRYILPERLHV